jgi:hypothetical protein
MNLRTTLSSAFFILKMIFIMPGIIIRYYLKRRSAIGHFKKELEVSGVPSEEAKELAKIYPFKLGDMIKIARGFSRQGF